MNAIIIDITPTIKAEYTSPKGILKRLNTKVKGITDPLIKLGTVVVTVALKLVPNCSEAVVTNTAQ